MADGWYVALAVETEERLTANSDRGAVGIDLGIKTLATLSDGGIAPALKPHRAQHKRMVRLSRSLARKQKGSANRAKANYSTVGIEDLNVAGMLRNGSLARSIADAGFGEFRRQLDYKAAMTGAQVIVIDRWFPSSKTCSECGAIHEITLRDRVIDCGCGLKMDRDLNAAINIRRSRNE